MEHVPGKSSRTEALDPDTGSDRAATAEPVAVAPRSAVSGQTANAQRPDASAFSRDRNTNAISLEGAANMSTRPASRMWHIPFDLAFAPDLRLLAVADVLYAFLDLASAKRR